MEREYFRVTENSSARSRGIAKIYLNAILECDPQYPIDDIFVELTADDINIRFGFLTLEATLRYKQYEDCFNFGSAPIEVPNRK